VLIYIANIYIPNIREIKAHCEMNINIVFIPQCYILAKININKVFIPQCYILVK